MCRNAPPSRFADTTALTRRILIGLAAGMISSRGLNSLSGVWPDHGAFAFLVEGVFHVGGRLARVSPLTFFRELRAPMSVAFGTASRGATLSVPLRTVEERLGADRSVASFRVRLGATINMDGTAIMRGVATVMLAVVLK